MRASHLLITQLDGQFNARALGRPLSELGAELDWLEPAGNVLKQMGAQSGP